MDIVGIAPRVLLDAVQQLLSNGQSIGGVLPPLRYFTAAPNVVFGRARRPVLGATIQRWNSALTTLRNAMGSLAEAPGASPHYFAYELDVLYQDCILILQSDDEPGSTMVGLSPVPSIGVEPRVIMWIFESAPADQIEEVLAIIGNAKPLVVREVHCERLEESELTAKRTAQETTSDEIQFVARQLAPYGGDAVDPEVLRPAAIVCVRAMIHAGSREVIFLKKRTDVTDHDDFNVLSLLSARLLEEDLAFSLNIQPAIQEADDGALDSLWIAAGRPEPFVIPEEAFVRAAQRELYITCGLDVAAERLRLCGTQVVDREDTGLQLGFAVFDLWLDREVLVDEVRAVEAWNPQGLVRVDRDRLFADKPKALPLNLNRLLRRKQKWLEEHVLSKGPHAV